MIGNLKPLSDFRRAVFLCTKKETTAACNKTAVVLMEMRVKISYQLFPSSRIIFIKLSKSLKSL